MADEQEPPQEPVLIWERWPPPGWTLLDSPDMQLRFPSATYGQQGLN